MENFVLTITHELESNGFRNIFNRKNYVTVSTAITGLCNIYKPEKFYIRSRKPAGNKDVITLFLDPATNNNWDEALWQTFLKDVDLWLETYHAHNNWSYFDLSSADRRTFKAMFEQRFKFLVGAV